jgi:predicted SPOUT superfamily RNA methylase MTH1
MEKRKRNDADDGRGRGRGRGRGDDSNGGGIGRGRGQGRGRGRGDVRGSSDQTTKNGFHNRHNNNNNTTGGHHNNNHRFGRVMPQPPKLKYSSSSSLSRIHPTVSIAIPGSVVSNAQTRELQTQLAGQIARAAAVFRVDEVVVYDDGLGTALNSNSNYRRGPSTMHHHRSSAAVSDKIEDASEKKSEANIEEEDVKVNADEKKQPKERPSTDPHAFLARILQYVECPQYLRRLIFPMHPDLQFAGLLPPLDAPHHLRKHDVSTYREGVTVINKNKSSKEVVQNNNNDDNDANDTIKSGSLVDCGIPNRLVRIDRIIPPGIRCTVKLDPKAYTQRSGGRDNFMEGIVVSPTAPRDEDGMYWGYSCRLASSMNTIFSECPYEGGYDLTVGTSERGDISIDDPKFSLKKKRAMTNNNGKKTQHASGTGEDDTRFNHLLIVFGGVAGIEECVDADESMTLPGEESRKLFDIWVNVCPYQGSRTIRSEEALFITLARLSPYIARNVLLGTTIQSKKGGKKGQPVTKTEDIEFSDEAVSEESSDEEGTL